METNPSPESLQTRAAYLCSLQDSIFECLSRRKSYNIDTGSVSHSPQSHNCYISIPKDVELEPIGIIYLISYMLEDPQGRVLTFENIHTVRNFFINSQYAIDIKGIPLSWENGIRNIVEGYEDKYRIHAKRPENSTKEKTSNRSGANAPTFRSIKSKRLKSVSIFDLIEQNKK